MAVGLAEPTNILPVDGVELAITACGIKARGGNDLVLVTIEPQANVVATFTRNAFCAAPVVVAREHLKTSPRALLINSGNANAGTGEQGMQDALQSCSWVAERIGCEADQVMPFSTGVIGEPMPMAALKKGIETAAENLLADNWLSAAKGIMTTDTVAKAVSKQIDINGCRLTLTGIAKGSGMICPNMATMLAFIATDAKVDNDYLQHCLTTAVGSSFNAITVDGDTSTNDACVLIASGKSGCDEINRSSDGAGLFMAAVTEVCQHLAHAVIRDGEGATKFVTIHVDTASGVAEARNVAYTIAHSPLVKTALFASDPNWGRILAAVGRSDLNNLVLEDVNIYLDDVCIVSRGARDAAYTEEQGKRVMQQAEITITVKLNRGDAEATVWTTDLSHEYVKINAEYRT